MCAIDMENDDDYVLKVTNLGVKIQNQTILDNVNFKLRGGTSLAIVGPNAAGKTMLFRTLLNLVPHTGKIEWTEKVKIGYVPQNITVDDIPISVKDFLSFKNNADAETSLSPVRLGNKNVADKTLGILSGGQLRRVLIAWALADNPNVLLFDEPTTGVDHDSEEPIFATLEELKRKHNITILLITHDVHIVREYSDYLLALNRCVTFFGESKEIMNPSVQKIIYGETVCVGTPEEKT
ncbi:MAG TPA: metal ABC transporter ATP-binding protein [Candidatus Bathyarchaeia archaeon]|nr:metal ABC transporter ATP-binding protein [Candidatus Bathyarchaeia archaeon]